MDGSGLSLRQSFIVFNAVLLRNSDCGRCCL